MGGRRWAVIGLAVLILVTGLGLVSLLTGSEAVDSSSEEAAVSGPAMGDASVPLPTSASGSLPDLAVSASPESGSSKTGDVVPGGAGSPGTPTRDGDGSQPPSPPPQPPPSPPVRPTPIPCTVSVYDGPMPGVPNIRIVVTADPNVDMVWATVSEGARSLRGAIALAGGRGEQIVDGVSQRARVTVFSDASMADATKSCSNLTD